MMLKMMSFLMFYLTMHIAVTWAGVNTMITNDHQQNLSRPKYVPIKKTSFVVVKNAKKKIKSQSIDTFNNNALLDLFRSTLKDTTLDKSALSKVFSANASPIDIELLADMSRYINRFAKYPQSAEVLSFMAIIHKRTKDYYAAVLDWELLKVMYPQSIFVDTANKELQSLGSIQLPDQVSMIERLNSKISLLSGDQDQRTGEFIGILRTSRNENFTLSIVAVSESFLARNATYQHLDIIESTIAHQQMLVNNEIAIFRFNKLLAVYPLSDLCPNSLISIARIQREKLKNFANAAKSYLALSANYPDSNEAKLGLEELATMYNVDMLDYQNAINTYETIIIKYKKDSSVLYSLLTLEKIYETKTFQPDKAIETFLKVAEIYKGTQDGLNALIEAADIATNSTKNWALAMSINDRIMQRSPRSEVAIRAAYSNAQIMENQLGDNAKAKKMYERFITEYSGHALAKEAKMRIEDMPKNL